MSTIVLKLRQVRPSYWQLFTPSNIKIGPEFKGQPHEAHEWALAFVSSWYNWSIELEIVESKYETTN